MQTKDPTISRKIILVQEKDEDIQNGFLMLVPLYKSDNATSEYGELFGFNSYVFRMNDFVEGILDLENLEHLSHIHFQIYDGEKMAENVFFDSLDLQPLQGEKKFYEMKTISVANRNLILTFEGDSERIGHFEVAWIGLLSYGMSIVFRVVTFLITKNIQLSNKILKKEKLELVGELTGRLAHDIRNPLSNILMSANLLREYKNVKDDEQVLRN